jgi:hypothetical protein
MPGVLLLYSLYDVYTVDRSLLTDQLSASILAPYVGTAVVNSQNTQNTEHSTVRQALFSLSMREAVRQSEERASAGY